MSGKKPFSATASVDQSDYFTAAYERFADADKLHKAARYGSSLYLVGCAIEAIMWAFIPAGTVGPRGRHSFGHLFDSGLNDRISRRYMVEFRGGGAISSSRENALIAQSKTLGATLSEASTLWSNSIRYFSEDRLKKRLRKLEPLRKTAKGDILKAASNRMLLLAQTVLTLGRDEWSR